LSIIEVVIKRATNAADRTCEREEKQERGGKINNKRDVLVETKK